MLQLLNKNIIEYVLNPYLNYNDDINKLKQLFDYKFNIKLHIHYEYYCQKYKIICSNCIFDSCENCLKHVRSTYINRKLNNNRTYYFNKQRFEIISYDLNYNVLKYFIYWPNGNLKNYTYKNKFQKSFYESGKICGLVYYNEHKIEAVEKEWNENGDKIKEKYLIGSYRNGLIIKYYSKEKMKYRLEKIDNIIKEEEWWENGNKKHEKYYKFNEERDVGIIQGFGLKNFMKTSTTVEYKTYRINRNTLIISKSKYWDENGKRKYFHFLKKENRSEEKDKLFT
jgi:antitoxin component YwqK of YwqJK toxin-antitoxin module